MKPLAVDLCCGLGGWSDGLLAEGWDVVGFDIERHEYGEHRYPAQLVLQDIRTIDGRQFRGKVSLIVASPPCQEFSYLAMPWSRGKQIARALRGDGNFPDGYTGSRTVAQMTALFDACVRIGREAECPIVIENVRGAQPWIGRARANYGSFFVWGDLPALMPMTARAQKFNPDGTAHSAGSWFAVADSQKRGWLSQAGGAPMRRDDCKVPGFRFDGSGRSFQTASVDKTVGVKQHKSGRAWFADPDSISGSTSSKSHTRKAASAAIARIPFPLARHIAAYWKPVEHRMSA